MLDVKFKPYKGYMGVVRKIDLEEGLIAGRVAGLHRDMISFYAASPKDLQAEFEASVDAYLTGCEEDGVRPEKPVSGNFQVRVSPDVHRALAREADLRTGGNMNRLVAEVLEDFVATQSNERATA